MRAIAVRNGWSHEEITAGLSRARLRLGIDSAYNPLPKLEQLPGWWRGKILTRKTFAEQDRERAGRFSEMAAVSPSEEAGQYAQLEFTTRARDMSFAAVAAAEKCHAIADQHEKAIDRYQRRLGEIANA